MEYIDIYYLPYKEKLYFIKKYCKKNNIVFNEKEKYFVSFAIKAGYYCYKNYETEKNTYFVNPGLQNDDLYDTFSIKIKVKLENMLFYYEGRRFPVLYPILCVKYQKNDPLVVGS
jgi:hypothetical protein